MAPIALITLMAPIALPRSDGSDSSDHAPIAPIALIVPITLSHSALPRPFTYLYGEIRPIPAFCGFPRGDFEIATWMFFIPHVGANHFFRSFI